MFAIFMLLFAQSPSDINYEFMKSGTTTWIKKSPDDPSKYKFSATFLFLSDNNVKHPLINNNDKIHVSKKTTKKINNNEVYVHLKFYMNAHNYDKKVYYYIIEGYGDIKPENMDSKVDTKSLVLQSMASAIADMGISFKDIKIDQVIPNGKAYINGKIVETSPLKY